MSSEADALRAISPLDGRYRARTTVLAPYVSEAALMKYRVQIEAEFFIAISQLRGFGPRALTAKEKDFLRSFSKLSSTDVQIIKKIETQGFKNIPATNHDVKAVEYFIRLRFESSS